MSDINKKYVLVTKTLETDLNFDKLLFVFNNMKVKKIADNKIKIDLIAKVYHFSSHSDAESFIRADLFMILGILSFITKQYYDVGHVVECGTASINEQKKFDDKIIVYQKDGVDLTEQLTKLLKQLNSFSDKDKQLFNFLLDRWRKAQYFLLQDSSDSPLDLDPVRGVDEALLSFYHVLELLVTRHEDEQKEKGQEQIKLFLEKLYKNILYDSQELQDKIKEKTKILKDTFSADYSIKSKIFFMLHQQGLLDDKVKYFIGEILSVRNVIAHGKLSYSPILVWPYPAFFTLQDDNKNLWFVLYRLTARMIDIDLKTDFWCEDWEECLSTIPVSPVTVKKFIKDKKYEDISYEDFEAGQENGVRPSDILNAMLEKKIKIDEFEVSIGKFIKDIANGWDDHSKDFNVSIGDPIFYFILLADAKDNELASYCVERLHKAKKPENIGSLMENYFYYLESKQIQVNKFKEFLLKK
ncbi:hypothetical protein [Commensalibacter papalotli (ex Servin-Garciduenas et al. 2014)]|uniref:Apea-like HEPN domain-containing protein n=1 Tax=Commensalibacter papalotli (ex Servin-Garciduenas et al. 2014) TaxID=1208583 RepID=W7DZ31_9PROT|nr:hypothetical protein [Commensalibacter papalotli (ex Servin-Garciduenas et al. 2014)]EUK19283.1 hypothetical protein COMX_06015 [Commensalibacter papalotli (ex Servin-Garciduenas et al. 2014)]